MNNEEKSSQKRKEDETSKKAAGVAAKGGIDYLTGGQGGRVYDSLKKAPIAGKKIDKAEEKAGKALNTATGGTFGKVAKKADDLGALNAANGALSMKNPNRNKLFDKGTSKNSKVKDDNVGKRNLNSNTDIAQPSKSNADREREKNDNKLNEQLQNNFARNIRNIYVNRTSSKNDKEGISSTNQDNDSKENKKEVSSKTKSFFTKKIVIYVAAFVIPFIFFIFALSIPLMAASRFLTLIGIGSAGNQADVSGASGGDEKLEEMYNNILEVQQEYQSNGKNFSADVIGGIYHILASRSNKFKPSDMTKSLIREIADNLFDEACEEEDENGEKNCRYNYNESTARNYLENRFFPKYLDKEECAEATDEVFTYLEDYKNIVGGKGGGGVCVINGDTQASIFKTVSQEEFFNIIGPIANQAYAQTGIFASVTIAQAIIEAGWGKHTPTADSNNLFGIKCSKDILSPSTWDGSCTEPVLTQENTSSGSVYTIMSSFKKFKNVEEAILDHSALLVSGGTYVRHGVAQATDPYEQIKRIKEAGYATDVNYVSKITNTIRKYNLEQWDITSSSSCVSSTGDYTTWRQKDPKWSNIKLGNTNMTVGSSGCMSTSIAMLVKKFNAQTTISGELDPGTFATSLSAVGGFDNRAFLQWRKVTEIVPSFKFGNNIELRGMSKAQKLSTIREVVNNNYAVIAEVMGDDGQHWVAIESVNGDTIKIMDPDPPNGSNSNDMWKVYKWKNTSRILYYTVG